MLEIPETELNARLRAYQAVHHADRSSAKANIFYSSPTRRWIRVMRSKRPGFVVMEFHATCPCGLGG